MIVKSLVFLFDYDSMTSMFQAIYPKLFKQPFDKMGYNRPFHEKMHEHLDIKSLHFDCGRDKDSGMWTCQATLDCELINTEGLTKNEQN